MTDFTHLHCHTDYSYLESLLTVESLCKGTSELGMRSIAITDRGTLAGVPSFIKSTYRYGLKPIIGCEVYVVGSSCQPDVTKPAFHSLVLIAMSQEGFRNLKAILATSEKVAPMYGVVTTKAILHRFNEGLIALSGAGKGEICRFVRVNDMQAAMKVAEAYSRIFGERLFLEFQPQIKNFEIQELCIELGNIMNIPCVATNNVHYLTPNQSDANELIKCLRDNTTLGEESRVQEKNDRSLMSPLSISGFFKSHPEVIENSVRIANQCGNMADISTGTLSGREYRFKKTTAFLAAARALGSTHRDARRLLCMATSNDDRSKLGHVEWPDDKHLERILDVYESFIGILNCRL